MQCVLEQWVCKRDKCPPRHPAGKARKLQPCQEEQKVRRARPAWSRKASMTVERNQARQKPQGAAKRREVLNLGQMISSSADDAPGLCWWLNVLGCNAGLSSSKAHLETRVIVPCLCPTPFLRSRIQLRCSSRTGAKGCFWGCVGAKGAVFSS